MVSTIFAIHDGNAGRCLPYEKIGEHVFEMGHANPGNFEMHNANYGALYYNLQGWDIPVLTGMPTIRSMKEQLALDIKAIKTVKPPPTFLHPRSWLLDTTGWEKIAGNYDVSKGKVVHLNIDLGDDDDDDDDDDPVVILYHHTFRPSTSFSDPAAARDAGAAWRKSTKDTYGPKDGWKDAWTTYKGKDGNSYRGDWSTSTRSVERPPGQTYRYMGPGGILRVIRPGPEFVDV